MLVSSSLIRVPLCHLMLVVRSGNVDVLRTQLGCVDRTFYWFIRHLWPFKNRARSSMEHWTGHSRSQITLDRWEEKMGGRIIQGAHCWNKEWRNGAENNPKAGTGETFRNFIVA